MNIDNLSKPDYDFSPVLLDKLMQSPLPRLRRADNYEQSGVYAWYDGDTGAVLYIGKAIKVRNRLQQHWYGATDIVERMFDDGIVPMVAVWLCPTEQRAALERTMLDIDMPLYNKRKD